MKSAYTIRPMPQGGFVISVDNNDQAAFRSAADACDWLVHMLAPHQPPEELQDSGIELPVGIKPNEEKTTSIGMLRAFTGGLA